jgi:hypothetical protein
MSNDKGGQKIAGYEVGYRNPPKHSRFKKGRSGNPKGRPKGAKSFINLLLAQLDDKIVVNENGRTRRITKREALAMLLVNQSLKGEFRAFRFMSDLIKPEEQRREEARSAAASGNSASDRVRKRLDDLAARMRARYQLVPLEPSPSSTND